MSTLTPVKFCKTIQSMDRKEMFDYINIHLGANDCFLGSKSYIDNIYNRLGPEIFIDIYINVLDKNFYKKLFKKLLKSEYKKDILFYWKEHYINLSHFNYVYIEQLYKLDISTLIDCLNILGPEHAYFINDELNDITYRKKCYYVYLMTVFLNKEPILVNILKYYSKAIYLVLMYGDMKDSYHYVFYQLLEKYFKNVPNSYISELDIKKFNRNARMTYFILYIYEDKLSKEQLNLATENLKKLFLSKSAVTDGIDFNKLRSKNIFLPYQAIRTLREAKF